MNNEREYSNSVYFLCIVSRNIIFLLKKLKIVRFINKLNASINI